MFWSDLMRITIAAKRKQLNFATLELLQEQSRGSMCLFYGIENAFLCLYDSEIYFCLFPSAHQIMEIYVETWHGCKDRL